MSDPYMGEIRMVGFDFAPYGWALCQGQMLPLAQNQALFTLLGTVYGGNGVQTFGLPDLRSRTPVGQGQGPGLSAYTIGETGGAESVTQLANNMPIHTHAVTTTATNNLGASTAMQVVSADATSPTPIAGGCLGIVNDGGGSTLNLYHDGTDGNGNPLPRVALATQAVPLTGGVTVTATAGLSGGSVALPVVSPFISLNFIIAMQGIFPTRG